MGQMSGLAGSNGSCCSPSPPWGVGFYLMIAGLSQYMENLVAQYITDTVAFWFATVIWRYSRRRSAALRVSYMVMLTLVYSMGFRPIEQSFGVGTAFAVVIGGIAVSVLGVEILCKSYSGAAV